jgi:hypothetical protein
MVPQYFFISGLRTDIDIRLGKSTWLSLAPQLYANENNDYYIGYSDWDDTYYTDEYKKLFGYGGHIGLIHYQSFQNNTKFQYLLGYGLSYMKSNVEYEGPGWFEKEYLGLQVLEYGTYTQETNIEQYGGVLYFGLYIPVDERFFIELYMGSKLKYSTYKFSGDQERRFNDNILKPGYTGILPYTGVRYGLRF